MAESGSGCSIRYALESDAEAIGLLIVRTLRFSNAEDYPPEVIERVAGNVDVASWPRVSVC
ncbi:hypothetical protein [Phytopseudomonas flavescens]|uniref:hypothetical protein n=1 Tax=Phytopseudomonas flavescens TaxID=29435 RepID=UPI0009FF0CE5|nr:hypothetical protein [Pseudomonas flavescens]